MTETLLAVRARATGLPSTDALIEVVRARVPDPSVFDEHPPVFVRADASNRRLDAYNTKMAESTHRLFAEGAIDGVSILNSHNSRSLGFGQSFDGRYIAGSQQRVEIDFYVQRGLRLNEVANDDLIDALRGGSVRDVSVGFIPGWYRCGLCDTRMLNFYGMAVPECGHWPGNEYPVSEKDPSKGMRTAFAWVEDARLSELSIVYDGATPGAQITDVKVRQLIDEGYAPPERVIELWEQRYQTALPRPARSFGGADIPAPVKEERMELTAEQIAAVRLALTETGAAADADVPAAVRALVDEVKGLRGLRAEVERLQPFEAECTRLRPLADEGRQYRADLVESAVTEGKRALGEAFAEETYRGLLEAAPVETVKRMRDDWKAVGDKQFPGGRVTRDESEPTQIGNRRRLPAAVRG